MDLSVSHINVWAVIVSAVAAFMVGGLWYGAIFGKASPVHQGRTTQVWDVEVSDESNARVIALFRCTQMILRQR